MNLYEINKLKMLLGDDYNASQFIKLHQPTIQEIVDFGEERYFSMVGLLTSSPYDVMGWLHENDIDYEEMSDFELFIMIVSNMTLETTSIIFGDLDFSLFIITKRSDNNEIILYQQKLVDNELCEIIIDRLVYERIMTFLRLLHGYTKNTKKAANEFTKRKLYEQYKYSKNRDRKFSSILYPLISSMVNTDEFKYDHKQVKKMPYYAFMDSVRRIQKIKSVEALYMSMTTYGFDHKSINPRKDLDWLGELDKT